jgi:hypothetical protein
MRHRPLRITFNPTSKAAPMTIQDLLNTIAADTTAVAADQAKLTADQATQTVDDTAFVSALSAAGITSFAVPSADGSSVAIYTIVASSIPPYTVAVIPTAGSITLPDAAVPVPA